MSTINHKYSVLATPLDPSCTRVYATYVLKYANVEVMNVTLLTSILLLLLLLLLLLFH